MTAVCEPQAKADFCNVTHWVLAPLCDVYDRGDELATYQMAQSFMCEGGTAVPKPEGAPITGAAGGGAGTGTSVSAGAAAPSAGGAGANVPSTAGSSASTPETAPKSSAGCSAVAGLPSDQRFGGLLLGLGTLAVLARTTRRRRAASH
jgi:hypothetical protein